MRHNKKFNHLSRTASHRAAMLSNMATSLILHKRITTTLVMSAMIPVKSMRIPGKHLAVIEMGTKKIVTTPEQKRATIATTLMNIMMSLPLEPMRTIIAMSRVQALRI